MKNLKNIKKLPTHKYILSVLKKNNKTNCATFQNYKQVFSM